MVIKRELTISCISWWSNEKGAKKTTCRIHTAHKKNTQIFIMDKVLPCVVSIY